MLDLMMSKRAVRLRAVFGDDECAGGTAVDMGTRITGHDKPTSPSAKAAAVTFTSPADIGPPAATHSGQQRTVTFDEASVNASATPASWQSTGHPPSSSSIMFPGAACASVTAGCIPTVPDEEFDASEFNAGYSTAAANKAVSGERHALSQPAAQQQREAFHPLGSIAERQGSRSRRVAEPFSAAAVPPAHAAASTHAGRSLFMRRMLGEGR